MTSELDPDDALDILLDQGLLADYLDVRGVDLREARQELMAIAAPLLDGRVSESSDLRRARKQGFRGRQDVEELCDFVERAARLPPRQVQVFHLTVVQGYTLRECAARLEISRETVRVHLRELRRAMRRTREAKRSQAGAEFARENDMEPSMEGRQRLERVSLGTGEPRNGLSLGTR